VYCHHEWKLTAPIVSLLTHKQQHHSDSQHVVHDRQSFMWPSFPHQNPNCMKMDLNIQGYIRNDEKIESILQL
jgi:hypothetical protein